MNKRYVPITAKYTNISFCGHSIFKGNTCYYDRQKKVVYCDVCGYRLRERELRQEHKNLLQRMRIY
jgi:hypothetical protein